MSSILSLNDNRRYHLYRKETDMRKSFDALCGLISNELGKNALTGDVFIFINKLENPRKLSPSRHGKLTPFRHFKLIP